MKLSHIFTLVVLLHLGVLGSLLIFPGCQLRPQGDRVPPKQPLGQSQTGGDAIQPSTAASVSESQTPRLPPTRPSWNVSTTEQPKVIQGAASSFNAIEVESDVMETITLVESVPATSVASSETSYTVKRGDTLTRIAREHGITLNELMAANGLNRDSVLKVDQVLKIPASGSPMGPAQPETPKLSPSRIDQEAGTYQVKQGDTLGAIASRYGTSVDALRSANSISGSTIYVGQTLLIPAAGSTTVSAPVQKAAQVETRSGEGTYVVKSGDTLERIARQHGLTVKELAERNNISDPRRLRVGATLVIPGASQGTSTTRAPATAPTSVPATAPAPRVSPAAVPAPTPASVQTPVAAPTPAGAVQTDTRVVEELDFEDMEDIPYAPVLTSE